MAQTFMVDTPNDALQSHKVLGQNSPRGRVGGQKSLKNPKNPEAKSGQGGGGGTGGGDHFGTIRHISINIDGTSPKLSWYIVLMMPYIHTKSQVKTHQGAGSVGKKVWKIPKIRKI